MPILKNKRDFDDRGLKEGKIEVIVTVESLYEDGFTATIEPKKNILKLFKDEDLKIVLKDSSGKQKLLTGWELKPGDKVKLILEFIKDGD